MRIAADNSEELAFSFESFGVLVTFKASEPALLDMAKRVSREALVSKLRFFDRKVEDPDIRFELFRDRDGNCQFLFEGETSHSRLSDEEFAVGLNSRVRLQVAERAKGFVFVHSGVVAFGGKALLMPAASFAGKTTLVKELIQIGATYLSDEYAVLDVEGMVHPYERHLSVRSETGEQGNVVDPVSLGATVAKAPLPVGMVAYTRFVRGAVWRPERLPAGRGILSAIPFVAPIKFNSEFSLKVLNATFSRAIIVESDRGEARAAAPIIKDFFERVVELG